MTAARMHADELEVTDATVRALVDRQLPRFAGLPLRRMTTSGSSNVLFRLGDRWVVRLARQPGGSAGIDKEVAHLPAIAAALPVAVPSVVAVGEPDLGYPERWSVVRWIDGRRPRVPMPSGPIATRLARDLAGTIAALHATAVPTSAPLDPMLHWYRSGPIAAVDADVRQALAACRAVPGLPLDLDACAAFWDAAMAAGTGSYDGPARWIHADLVAENVLVGDDGVLTAVLDFGSLALGDPAVDLIGAWELFGPADRAVFRAALGVDDAAWGTGRAWALAIALITFPYYWRTLPDRCTHRLVAARAVLDDASTTR